MDSAGASVNSLLQPPEATTPCKTPSKSRSHSDPPATATLAPSPNFREHVRRESKDDNAVPTTPKALRRPDFLARSLSLQMPPSPHTRPSNNVPLSPQLDQANIYSFMNSQSQTGSPATSLPRHSRGLDFSRASTNLHHSTVAERQEPDSSPVLTQKGINIPLRKMSVSSMALDSPALIPASTWGSLAPERSTVSSSVGSVNMLGSDSDSSESDEDASMAGDDNDDAIFTTPQVHKLQNPSAPTPFAPSFAPTGPWGGAAAASSPAAQSLMKTIRRTRLHNKNNRKSRKNSSSASNSGYSSMASPRAGSPPPIRSIEPAHGGGYLPWSKATQTRRESLAMGTDGLNLSSGNDSGDEASATAPSTPGVVRRPVTRRGNLLPKTKGFARIRAALLEESAPVDSEIRRESETIRQVRERDNSTISDFELTDPTARPQTATAASSPSLLPAVPESAQEDFGRDDIETDLNNAHTATNGNGLGKGLGMLNFSLHAHRNGSGMDYWHPNRTDASMRTPPPPNFARQGSSVMSDFNMDSPGQASETGSLMFPQNGRMRARARSSASDASDAFAPTISNGNGAATGNAGAASSGMNDDMHLKKFKRRREDDFDIATIKRRAVSPGMSSQNSPILAQSPQYRDNNGVWGQPPERKKDNGGGPNGGSGDGSLQQSRSGSTGSNASAVNGGLASQGRKLGLQGMTDTNDGLMKMSIE